MSFLFGQCQPDHHDDTANVDMTPPAQDPRHVGMVGDAQLVEGLNFDVTRLAGHDQQDTEEEQGMTAAQKQADEEQGMTAAQKQADEDLTVQKKADAMGHAIGWWISW